MTRFLLLFACVTASVQAANYYVTQAGAGTHAGTSLGNAWSVSNYNASATPTGGDTVFFSGTITSGITPGSSGTGNSTSRLVLDFSGATLNTANPSLNFNGQNYITATGGGSWSGGVYTAAGIIGPLDNRTAITFGNQQSHDITVQGFQSLTTSDTTSGGFMLGQFCYNLLIQDNNLDNISNFFYGDKNSSHDIIFRNNYARTNHNQVVQTDVIQYGDAANVTVEGNKLIQRANGTHAAFHNDILQNFRNGGSLASNPTGLIVRYNWFELDVQGGEGDTSWTLLENMADSGGTVALKMYGNVFVGIAGTVSDEGVFMGVTAGATVYCYNNTFITRSGRPTNTVRFISSNAADRLYSRNNIGADVVTNHGGTALDWTFIAGAPWGYNYFFNWNNPSATYYGSGTGAPNTDPLFLSPTTNNFSLQSGSPCRIVGDATIGSEYNQGIAAGATWPNPTLVTRTAGSWSVGAYQYAGITLPSPDPSLIAGTTPTSTSIAVTAATTTGGAGAIQYNHAINGAYSGWQTSPTRTFTGLTPATTYQLKVQARDSASPTPNTTTESGISFVATLNSIPAAPSSLAAIATSATSTAISWIDNSTNELNFELERSPTGSTWTQIATPAAGATSYSNTGLTASTTYFYRIRAVNGAGSSAYSNVTSATTPANPPPSPSPSTIASVTADSGTQITLVATIATSSTNPPVQYNHAIGGVYQGWQSSATRIFTGLTPVTTYSFKVKARDAALVETVESAVSTRTTLAVAPVITTNPSSQSVTAGVNVTFTAAASGTPIPTWQWLFNASPIPGQTASTLTLFSVTPANAGSYSATATNSAGNATTSSATLTVNSSPQFTSAVVGSAGTSLTMNLSVSCTTGTGGNTGISLVASGGALSATYSSGSGSTAYVYTLSRTLNFGETITISYTQPGNGIEATTGGVDLPSFSGFSVTNNSTQGIPTVTAATIPTTGGTIVFTLSRSCTTGSGGSAGVTLIASGGAVTATYSTGSGSSTYTYSTSRTIGASEVVTVSYAQPGNGIEGTSGGVDLASFTNRSVTNNSTRDVTPPLLLSGSIATSGAAVSFTFSEAIVFGAGGNGGWTPTFSGGAATLTYSAGSGTTTLVYGISRTVNAGELTRVNYVQPGNGLEDSSGNDFASVTNVSIANLSTQGTTPQQVAGGPRQPRGHKNR